MPLDDEVLAPRELEARLRQKVERAVEGGNPIVLPWDFAQQVLAAFTHPAAEPDGARAAHLDKMAERHTDESHDFARGWQAAIRHARAALASQAPAQEKKSD